MSSLGCNLTRTGNDGGAVSRMWVFQVRRPHGRPLSGKSLPLDPAQKQRLIGLYVTHPWYFYAHYGTPVRTLASGRKACNGWSST